MPPQKKSTEVKTIETVEAPALAADHDPKVAVEKSDLPEEPIKTSGAVPATVVESDGIDESATKATVTIDHPTYGRISLADLEEVIRAEVTAEARRKRADEEAKLPELCEEHFPEGWESKNAVDQDGVGCEHGNWSRTRAKDERGFPEDWKARKPQLASE